MTSTELGYLSGVTSNIQTQLDGKAEKIARYSQFAKISGRPSTCNLEVAYGGINEMFHFLVSSNMTEGRDTTDPEGHIVQLNWDGNGGYDSQLLLTNNTIGRPWLQFRGSCAGTWYKWHTCLSTIAHPSFYGTSFPTAIKTGHIFFLKSS